MFYSKKLCINENNRDKYFVSITIYLHFAFFNKEKDT